MIEKGEMIVEHRGVSERGGSELLQVGDAGDGFPLGSCLVQGGEKQGGENRDDRDGNQKFDQSERSARQLSGFHTSPLFSFDFFEQE